MERRERRGKSHGGNEEQEEGAAERREEEGEHDLRGDPDQRQDCIYLAGKGDACTAEEFGKQNLYRVEPVEVLRSRAMSDAPVSCNISQWSLLSIHARDI